MPDDAALAPSVSAGPTDPRAVIAAWYLRKWHRRLWVPPLTVGLVVFIAILILRGTAEDPKANFQASKAACLALSPPPVPGDENAAEDYQLANKAFVAFAVGQGQSQFSPSSNSDLTGDSKLFERPDVLAYLTNNAPAIQHLYAGAAKPKCNWGRVYDVESKALHSSYIGSQLFEGLNLLALRARVSAHAGDHKTAAEAIKTIYKLAEHERYDQLFRSCHDAASFATTADRTVQAIVTWDTPSNLDDLAAYRKAIWKQRWEKKVVLGILAAWKTQGLGYMDGVASGVLGPGIFNVLPASHLKSGAFGYGSERHSFVAVMDELIASHARGQRLSEKDISALIAKNATGPTCLTVSIVPYVRREIARYAGSEEQGLVTDAGLALLMFRVKNGRDPKSLDELVPEFMPAVPTGIRCPQPLGMSVEPEGTALKNNGSDEPVGRPPGAIRIFTVKGEGKDGAEHFVSRDSFVDKAEYRGAFWVPPLGKQAQQSVEKAP